MKKSIIVMSLCFVFTAPSLGMYAGESLINNMNRYRFMVQDPEGEKCYSEYLSDRQKREYIKAGFTVFAVKHQGESMITSPIVGTPPSRCAKFFEWICCK